MTVELERAGHEVSLVCKRGSEARVIDRARGRRVCRAHRDARLRRAASTRRATPPTCGGSWVAAVEADVVHVHRGKEHWLAALANRLSRTPRPLFRTRHIVQPVRAARPQSLALRQRATALVVTVTEAIRRQYWPPSWSSPTRVVALPGGVDSRASSRGSDRAPRSSARRLGVARRHAR